VTGRRICINNNILSHLYLQQWLADDFCTRGDGKPGYCVHNSNCAKIFDMLKRNRGGTPHTPEDLIYIGNSRCVAHNIVGLSIPQGYVCCESEDTVSQGIQELSSQDCGMFEHNKMIGGTEIALMSRPWMALLRLRSKFGIDEFGCGGTIINKRK